MRSKRILFTRKVSRRKNQYGGSIEPINDIEHLNTLLTGKEIKAVQVIFNNIYKDYTDAQTNDDTFKLLKRYLTNKDKYNVSKIYNIKVLKEEPFLSQEKSLFERIYDFIPFTSPAPIQHQTLNHSIEIPDVHTLNVLKKLNRLEQIRVEFDNFISYGDIEINKITQEVIKQYLIDKDKANIQVIYYN